MKNTQSIKNISVILATLILSVVLAGVFATKVAGLEANYPTTAPTTPPVNNAPQIQPDSTSLKAGYLNKPYSSEIRVIDIDSNLLSVTVTGLPKGVYARCKVMSAGRILCPISGTPTQRGEYKVVVTAKDKKGAVTIRSYKLLILSR